MADWTIREQPFVCNTTSGDQTITLTGGPGQTPKAVILVIQGATALGTLTNHMRLSFGMTDFTTTGCVAEMAENGVATANADTGSRIDNGAIANIPLTASEAKEARATVVSAGTDAITINWAVADVPASAYRGIAIFFFGTELSAQVNLPTTSATVGVGTDVTTTFTPTFLIAACNGQAWAADTGAGESAMFIGFAANGASVTHGSSGHCAEDRQSASSVGCEAFNDRIVTHLTSAAGTVSSGATVVASFGSGKYTLTTQDVNAALSLLVLAVKPGDARAWAGAPEVDTDGLGVISVTGVGFKPKTVFASATRVAALTTINSGNGPLSFGIASSASSRWTCGLNAVDAITTPTPSSTQSYAQDSLLIAVPTNSAGFDWQADIESFDTDGFSLDIIDPTPAATVRRTAFLAIEDPTELVITETEEISDSTAVMLATSLSETEQISDSAAIMAAEALSETEQISDQMAMSGAEALSETEEISDQMAMAATEALSETETITDEVAMMGSVTFQEDEQIADEAVLITAAIANLLLVIEEQEQIEDAAAFAAGMALSETVEIEDRFNFFGSALMVVSETEAIADEPALYLGRVVVSSDEEQISDEFSSGRGLIPSQRGTRGTAVQGGAVAGTAVSARAERGEAPR